jgi:hypothetical protein
LAWDFLPHREGPRGRNLFRSLDPEQLTSDLRVRP